MTTTEIHVPITLNEQFAIMSCLLVKSLAARADFPGDWRVVFTISRDSTLDISSRHFDWAGDYPVEFRWMDQTLWDRHRYIGTGLQSHLYDYKADAVIFMDADIVVTGPIDEVILEAASTDTLLAWPAWQPPSNLDIEDAFARRGVTVPKERTVYSGYGLAFMEPRFAPPYFNYGFVVLSRSSAHKIGSTITNDIEFMCKHYRSSFNSQVALGFNIIENDIRYRSLDMRFNCSNGNFDKQILSGPEADAYFAKAVAEISDTRILHYNRSHPEFRRTHEMSSWELLAAFRENPNVGEGSARLQRALRGLF